MTLDVFLSNMELIFDFMVSLLIRISEIVTTYYILMLPVAIWVVYRVCKLFHLL